MKYVGNIGVVFHGSDDEPITLYDVSYLPSLRFSLFSFHELQQTHVIILDVIESHIMGIHHTLPCDKNGSYMKANWRTLGTVGETQKQIDL